MATSGRNVLPFLLSMIPGLGLVIPLAEAADFRPVNGLSTVEGARLSSIEGHVSVVVGGADWSYGEDVYDWGPVAAPSLIGHIVPTGQGNAVRGVSADGHAVVGYDRVGGSVAFRWTPTGGRQTLGTLAGASAESAAYAVSADGSVIVGQAARPVGGGYAPFRWTEATGMESVGDLPGLNHSAAAEGVSANGQFIVGISVAYPSGGFRWDAINGLIGVGDLAGGEVRSRAVGVSDDGAVVTGTGSSASFGSEAFRWTAATGIVGLGTLPGGSRSEGTQVSGDGSTILGSTDQGAFIWSQSSGMRKLSDVLAAGGAVNLSGWNLDDILDVSYDGTRILGRGNKGLFLADLVADPVPVPPEAVDDGPYLLPPGIAEPIPVGTNDTSFTDPVTVTVTTPPTKGTITEISSPGPATGMFITYTANIGAVGADSFVYEMTDSTSASDSATVRIAIDSGPIQDADADGVADDFDNCPATANADQVDSDEDGPGDTCDNCALVVNTLAGNVPGSSPPVPRYQLDSDSDGYGNACDADVNNSGTTTTSDYAMLRSVFGRSYSFSANAARSDLNGSGTVTASDFAILRAQIGLPPGPSGLACAGTIPCP